MAAARSLVANTNIHLRKTMSIQPLQYIKMAIASSHTTNSSTRSATIRMSPALYHVEVAMLCSNILGSCSHVPAIVFPFQHIELPIFCCSIEDRSTEAQTGTVDLLHGICKTSRCSCCAAIVQKVTCMRTLFQSKISNLSRISHLITGRLPWCAAEHITETPH